MVLCEFWYVDCGSVLWLWPASGLECGAIVALALKAGLVEQMS